MTGFDNIMRSQQHVAQNNAFYDSQRYRAMEGTGQAAAEAMRFSAELGMQRTEQAMRLADHEQQFQSNALKLQAMSQIDQADLMREQVVAAKLANEAVRQQIAQRERALGYEQSMQAKSTFADVVRAIGTDELAALGLKPNPSSLSFDEMGEDDQKAYQERRRHYSSVANESRHRAGELRRAFFDETMMEWSDPAMETEYRSLMGLPGRQGGGGGVLAPQQPKAKADPDVDSISSKIVGDGYANKADTARRAIAARGIVRQLLQQQGRENVSDEVVMETILELLNDTSPESSQRRQALLELLGRMPQ